MFDSDQKYCEILEKEDLLEIDRIDSPWRQDTPNFPDHNAKAYQLIDRKIRRLQRKIEKQQSAISSGVLLLGNAGTGKTHLLMRVAKNLKSSHLFTFVRKPSNEDNVAQHIWQNILKSLTHKLPMLNSGKTQLDQLLAHVFTAVLIPVLESDIERGKNAAQKSRWLKSLQSSPSSLFVMLGDGERKNQNMNYLRRITLTYFQNKHPEIDQTIARALISYCFLTPKNKQVLLSWLEGQPVEEGTAKLLGIGEEWIQVAKEASCAGIRQQKEDQALRAISTIGILAGYYQPIVVAFDQLEGLRGEQRLTQRWADTVREIFTMTPNLLIITSMIPELWQNWFAKELDHSAQDRISQSQITLDDLTEDNAYEILKVHLKSAYDAHQLPSEIYPFAAEDVCTLYKNSTTLRTFLKNAREKLDDWIDGDVDNAETPQTPPPETTDATNVIQIAKSHSPEVEKIVLETLHTFQEKSLKSYKGRILNDETLLNRAKSFVVFILQHMNIYSLENKAKINVVMPCNSVISTTVDKKKLCIAACNQNVARFRTRLKNFMNYQRVNKCNAICILLRDKQCFNSEGIENMIDSMAQQGCYVPVGKEEFSILNSLHKILELVEEKSLQIEERTITKEELFSVIVTAEIWKQSKLYQFLIFTSKWLSFDESKR